MMRLLLHRVLHRDPLPYGGGCKYCDGERLAWLLAAAEGGRITYAAATQAMREATQGETE